MTTPHVTWALSSTYASPCSSKRPVYFIKNIFNKNKWEKMWNCLYNSQTGSLFNVFLWSCIGKNFHVCLLVYLLKQNFNNSFLALLHITNKSQTNSFSIKVLVFFTLTISSLKFKHQSQISFLLPNEVWNVLNRRVMK